MFGLVCEVLLGVESEGLRGEADVGVGGGGDREELVEDGGVLAEEFDGAEGELEGVFDEGDGEGFGGFVFNKGFEGKHGFEVFLALYGVVEAAVADEFEGSVEESAVVERGARGEE